jgi:hypothetical protein
VPSGFQAYIPASLGKSDLPPRSPAALLFAFQPRFVETPCAAAWPFPFYTFTTGGIYPPILKLNKSASPAGQRFLKIYSTIKSVRAGGNGSGLTTHLTD